MKSIEIVRDHDGTYYANVFIDGEWVSDLPEYVGFKTLKAAVRKATGVLLPKLKEMKFKRFGRKEYAHLTA